MNEQYNREMLDLYKRIKELDYHYYVKNSNLVPDSEYDKLKKEFKAFETNNCISVDKRLSKSFGMIIPIGKRAVTREAIYKSVGMEDAFDMKEAIGNITKFESNSTEIHVSNKIDGLTGRLFYTFGMLTQVLTRGDGTTGEEVTASFLNKINNLEALLFIDAFKDIPEVEVRGEISATWETTKKFGYSSARSFASGTLRSEKSEDNERDLNFSAFDCLTKDAMFSTKKAMFNFFEENGINTPNYIILDVSKKEDIRDLEKLWKAAGIGSEVINHPLDGLVIAINDMNEYRNTDFNRFAFKFEEEEHIVEILDIKHQVGKSGKLTPVAVTETWTSSDGGNNNNLTLHNYNLWEDAGIGSFIKVIKSAGVIPKIVGIDTAVSKLVVPDLCPCCKSKILSYKTAHYCSGVINKTSVCTDSLSAKLVDFCDTIGVKGMGIENAKAIILYISNNGLTPVDLWNLIEYRYNYSSIIGANGDKLAKQIDEASGNITNAKLLEAMSYDLIGGHISTLLCERFSLKNDLLNEFFDFETELGKIDGIGDTIISSLKDDMEHEEQTGVLLNLIEFFKPIDKVIEVMEDSKIKDWSVVITGKFIDENGEEVVRGNLGDYLKQYGAILKSSVSKKTNLLIVGEEPGAVKIAEAKKNEVRIMQVNEFLDFIKG